MSQAPHQAAGPLIEEAIGDLFPEATDFVVAVRSKNGHVVISVSALPDFMRETLNYLVESLVMAAGEGGRG